METVEIEVQMFAAARQAAGSERIQIEVAQGAIAGDVLAEIGRRIPELLPLLPSCRLAIDNQYVPEQTRVSPSSELALIPPVSGG